MAQPAQKKTRCERTLIFSSESVTEGLPDKLFDEAAYAELDTCLHQDPESHVACETALKDNNDVEVMEGTYVPYQREREEKEKEKQKESEKTKEKEKKQWDEHDAHIAAYVAADDPWMQLLML